jgi:hypothetical protein
MRHRISHRMPLNPRSSTARQAHTRHYLRSNRAAKDRHLRLQRLPSQGRMRHAMRNHHRRSRKGHSRLDHHQRAIHQSEPSWSLIRPSLTANLRNQPRRITAAAIHQTRIARSPHLSSGEWTKHHEIHPANTPRAIEVNFAIDTTRHQTAQSSTQRNQTWVIKIAAACPEAVLFSGVPHFHDARLVP